MVTTFKEWNVNGFEPFYAIQRSIALSAFSSTTRHDKYTHLLDNLHLNGTHHFDCHTSGNVNCYRWRWSSSPINYFHSPFSLLHTKRHLNCPIYHGSVFVMHAFCNLITNVNVSTFDVKIEMKWNLIIKSEEKIRSPIDFDWHKLNSVRIKTIWQRYRFVEYNYPKQSGKNRNKCFAVSFRKLRFLYFVCLIWDWSVCEFIYSRSTE